MRLTDDKDLWYKYGVDFQEAQSKEGDLLANLIKSFLSKGRKRYTSQSAEQIRQLTQKQIRQLLAKAYTESLWTEYGTGIEYSAPRGINIPTDLERGIICEKLDDYTIVWKLEPTILVEGDTKKEAIFGRKLLQAESILIKTHDGRAEVRAKRSGKKFIQSLFRDLGLQKIKAPIITEDISKNIEQILKGESAELRLVKVKFFESSLPFRSKLSIENSAGVGKDLEFLSNKNVLSSHSVTDLKEMIFEILESGRNFTLKMKLLASGYYIDVDDKKLSTKEREDVTRLLRTYGIPVRSVCSYNVKDNLRTIFHKMLSGSIRAYDEYYTKLPSQIAEVIGGIAKPKDDRRWACQTCGRQFDNEIEACSDCGDEDLSVSNRTLGVDLGSIAEIVKEKFEELGNTFSANKSLYNITNIGKIGSSFTIPIDFTKSEQSNGSVIAQPFSLEVLLYSGKEAIPKPIENYLKLCALVTYGEAGESEKIIHKFGVVDLFDLVCSSDERRKELFDGMITGSIRGIEDRVARLSSDALVRLQTPSQISDKEFERDIFYVFKRLFPLTERLGRIGKKEADGLVVHVDQRGECLISSFDAKLSKSEYKLASSEQRQAAFYILGEEVDPRINIYTKGKGVKSHVIVGNNFEKAKLTSFLEGAAECLSLAKAQKVKVPIVVIEVREFLEIYSMYADHLPHMSGDQFVKNVFHEEFWKILSTDKSSKLVSHSEVKQMKDRVLQAVSSSSFKPSFR